MLSALRSRPFLVAFLGAAAIFLAVLMLLGVRMAEGHDPALGAGTQKRSAPDKRITHAQAPVQQQPAEEQGYADGYQGGYDEGYAAPAQPQQGYGDGYQGGYGDGYSAPQQAPVAPVQSGTS